MNKQTTEHLWFGYANDEKFPDDLSKLMIGVANQKDADGGAHGVSFVGPAFFENANIPHLLKCLSVKLNEDVPEHTRIGIPPCAWLDLIGDMEEPEAGTYLLVIDLLTGQVNLDPVMRDKSCAAGVARTAGIMVKTYEMAIKKKQHGRQIE